MVRSAFQQLFAPLLDAKPPPGGWQLVDWDDEQGLCLTLGCGDDFLLVELERRDDARPCYARTDRFNICARRLRSGSAPALSAIERRVVDQLTELVSIREHQLPRFERPTVHRRAAVREIRVDRLLVREGAGQYYINPYVGCLIGCPYCYVARRADLSRSLAGLPALPWGRYVDVKINAAEVLRREARTAEAGPVRLSPILTDPYQPLERRYRITRKCLEVLLDRGFTPMILTRAARVVDDLDLLVKFTGAVVGLSIPTDDDTVRRAFEPGADPIEARIAALERLHDAGLRTFVVVQPMLPMNPRNLVSLVAPHIGFARVDRMHCMDKALPQYLANDLEVAATDEFFERTGRELREAFHAEGIVVDDLDDMSALVSP